MPEEKRMPPEGKYIFGFATVGAKGQIVIPKKARDVFNIKPGDSVLMLGDEKTGIAISNDEKLKQAFFSIMAGLGDSNESN